VALSKTKLDKTALAALRAEPDPEPDDLEALDAAWEDEEVLFGPGAASGCGKDGLTSRIRASRRPAEGMAVPPPRRPIISHSGNSNRK
jgi:nitrate reductase delta subunit